MVHSAGIHKFAAFISRPGTLHSSENSHLRSDIGKVDVIKIRAVALLELFFRCHLHMF